HIANEVVGQISHIVEAAIGDASLPYSCNNSAGECDQDHPRCGNRDLVSSYELPDTIAACVGARNYRVAFEKPPQVLGELFDRSIAPRWLLLQRHLDNVF